MRYVAGGIDEVRSLTRLQPWTILGAGLVTAVATAIVPLAFGRSVLEAGFTSAELPIVGTVKVASSLPFDVGVYLLVIGLVLMVFEAFGDEPVLEADP
jgi:multisubunit Na+/H+ antiporter MnhB subunit